MKRSKHAVRLCNCCACKAKRARAAKVHAVLHSRMVHILVFLCVAAGMCLIARLHATDGVSLGAVAVKGMELVGECIADRMFPPEILRS